ncbi:hypothetical protein [Shouchella clausii]|uniref:hypothetical protein n=1 Tax=Shouchella clausii TaxID=79880 RepID=UPI001C731EFE|nr:hypothetical protein [Shouchella clausii]MBX0320186.1 hypothetical protein [Shouchella clausii]
MEGFIPQPFKRKMELNGHNITSSTIELGIKGTSPSSHLEGGESNEEAICECENGICKYPNSRNCTKK